jgi:hypothetical protein
MIVVRSCRSCCKIRLASPIPTNTNLQYRPTRRSLAGGCNKKDTSGRRGRAPGQSTLTPPPPRLHFSSSSRSDLVVRVDLHFTARLPFSAPVGEASFRVSNPRTGQLLRSSAHDISPLPAACVVRRSCWCGRRSWHHPAGSGLTSGLCPVGARTLQDAWLAVGVRSRVQSSQGGSKIWLGGLDSPDNSQICHERGSFTKKGQQIWKRKYFVWLCLELCLLACCFSATN